jgi:hypothetical protein
MTAVLTSGAIARQRAKARAKAKAERESKRLEREESKRPTVSATTRTRLYEEAINSCAFEGMTPDEIKAEVDQRISRYLRAMPWWFCRTQSADARSRANVRAYRIQRGLIVAGEVPAGLQRHRQEQLSNIYEGTDASSQ